MHENISESRLAGCSLTGALAVTAFLTDAVTVIHAPQGCAHQIFSMLHALMTDAEIDKMPSVIVSNLSDRDVIFGGEEALHAAISKAAEQNPAFIVVVTSCVPETIGDDCQAVCRKHLAAEKIVYIPTSGFLGGSAQDGENAALCGLAGRVRGGQEIIFGSVALIGEKNLESEVEENYSEVERLLSRLGLFVSLRFCRNISAADISRLGSVQCCVFRDERVRAAGEEIARRLNKPYVSEFPRGLDGCITFLRACGAACGLPAEQIDAAVDAEKAYQAQMLHAFDELAGTTIALGVEPFSGTHAVAREAMARLNISEAAGGMQVKLPFYLPVGLSGTMKMLYLWRREARK